MCTNALDLEIIILKWKLIDKYFYQELTYHQRIPHCHDLSREYNFPLNWFFYMTINKVQGQTIDKVEIYLPKAVFNHGQFYLALPRTTTFSDLKIQVQNIEPLRHQML